jgi:hypothetical protein
MAAENGPELGRSVQAEIDHSKTRLGRFSNVYCTFFTSLDKAYLKKRKNYQQHMTPIEKISQQKLF